MGRARILRQIQSNKAGAADKWQRGYLVIAVVVATIVSVIGFAGAARIATILSAAGPAAEVTRIVEAIFNIAVFTVLIITLVGLVFRFGEQASRHYRSLEVLTEFMRDCTDQVSMHDGGIRRIRLTDLDLVRTRYKGILATLPPSTDKEYAQAKADDAGKKELKGAPLASTQPASGFDGNRGSTPNLLPPQQRNRANLLAARLVGEIFAADSTRMTALRALQAEMGSTAWIAGGFVREAVWDSLEGLKPVSPRDDVDVIYFDRKDTSKDAERAIRDNLTARAPGVRWSVKNQARMHFVNNDEEYKSLEEAVARFPETASAVAVQLDRRRLTILAPVGLQDLVELRLRQNPAADAAAFLRRRAQVVSNGRWPLLEVVD